MKMNGLIKYTLTVLVVTMMLAALPTEAEGDIYEDTLRLHIIANSDTAEDQELKLRVRDFILTEYGARLKSGKNIEDAKDKLFELLGEIETDVSERLGEWGYGYSVRVALGEEWYDTREYEDFTLPAGYYTSLRVIIGEGEGKNWWCVMYPPLCMEMATENAPADDGVIDYTKEELTLIKTGKYNVKFKILEELSRVFAKNG